ncbi:hypothetical protein AB0870_08430 [Microbacterium proteolyticum]|uniref:hypothetical protein n=1 Tax=Microbacterium proteolyticum TaxID=1572644 RepID=UPI00345C4FE8
MSLQDWGLLGTAFLAIATALGTLVKTWADRRAGIRGAEHTERRDTVADRDAFIDQIQEQLTAANALAAAADARAASSESARRAALELLDAEREYAQVLRDHIYRGAPPPPPPRPIHP